MTRLSLRPDRVVTHLVLIAAMSAFQACYQDSPPSTPRHAVDSLAKLLTDQDWVMRRTAAEGLGKIGDSSQAGNLLQVLGDASPDVREAAARSLGRLGPIGTEAGRRLAGLLMDSSLAVRNAAAQSLGAIEADQEIVSGMVASLANERPEVRAAAAAGLLGLDISGGYEEVLRKATDGDAQLRQIAVAVLGDQADDRGVAMLIDRLMHDVDANVRAEAAYRLGFHADGRVRTGLETAVDRDVSPQVRRWAQQSLAGLKPKGGSDSMPRSNQSDLSGLAPQSR